MFTARYVPYSLTFAFAAGTSRGILHEKKSFFITLESNEKTGIGECSLIPGLSIDDRPDFESKLKETCVNIKRGIPLPDLVLNEFPSISFGLETAFWDFENGGNRILFPGSFSAGQKGIPINGLIWMSSPNEMLKQVYEKLALGFTCIKLKIGANDFLSELHFLKYLRAHYSSKELEIRLDANGAFLPNEAIFKLQQLSDYDIHSIEQPIRAGQWQEMAEVCLKSPIPVALDEELISIQEPQKMKLLLSTIKPTYIILKPSLLGGLAQAEKWITIASELGINWWATSALESNIGLNAIAQWVSELKTTMVQGLGTGQIYTNNIPSPLCVENAKLWYKPSHHWDIEKLSKTTPL